MEARGSASLLGLLEFKYKDNCKNSFLEFPPKNIIVLGVFNLTHGNRATSIDKRGRKPWDDRGQDGLYSGHPTKCISVSAPHVFLRVGIVLLLNESN
jgi:hypothetical protein